MKKTFIIFVLFFAFCMKSSAESYYFKGCEITDKLSLNYNINLKKKTIDVELKKEDGQIQKFSHEIKKIEDKKIISEKIKISADENYYNQYFLNAESKTVTKLGYKKEIGTDINVFNLIDKNIWYCKDIKADWNIKIIDEAKINKEEKEILKAQDQIKNEQKSIEQCQNNDYKKWTNCKGTYKTETGIKFTGLYKNGEIIKGVSLYLDGAKYVGEFKNFKPNGYGTFVWANNEKYYGEWKNGKSHGNGTKIWKDGRNYSGQFQNDVLHGSGTLFYPDGKKYQGQFLKGKRHGQGTFTYSDGTAYIGSFIDGKEDGIGECLDKEGKTISCKITKEAEIQKFSGENIRQINIVAKKWVRISQYESNTKKGKKIMDQLKADFDAKAIELCKPKVNYKTLEKRMQVLEVNETPAYGLEAKLKIAIDGAVECLE